MSYLAFVRHGLSQANIDNITAGHTDTPLSPIGEEQAKKTAQLLTDIKFDRAFGSPLDRARRTLEIIIDELKNGVEPSFHDELKERLWGDVEGTPYKSRANGKYTHEEERDWFTWTGKADGGESYQDIHNRLIPFFDKKILPLLKQGKNVLVVGHNGMSKPLQRHIENLPYEMTTDLDLQNCQVKLYEFDDQGRVMSVASRLADGPTGESEK